MSCHCHLTHLFLKYFYLFITLLATNLSAGSVKMPSETAIKIIKHFRSGHTPYGETNNLVKNNKIDEEAFSVLREGLARENQDVREKIVDLLEQLGQQTTEKTGGALTNDSIISALATEGISKDDTASDKAIGVLISRCTQKILEKHNNNYIEALKERPGIYLFLIVAKAKPNKAKPVISELMKTEKWKNNTYAEIAAAALGDKEIEEKYIDAAKNATTGEELKSALNNLKYIGTRSSLQTVATFLRSPLVVGPLKTSLRLEAINALRFNYLEEDFLDPWEIESQKDYARVEKFVADVLDVHFSGSLPPFYKDTPLPTPLQ